MTVRSRLSRSRHARKRLAAFMLSKDWGVADLARATKLDHSTVSKILAGKRSTGIEAASAFEDVTAGWDRGPIRTAEWVGQESVAHATSVRPTGASTPSSKRRAA